MQPTGHIVKTGYTFLGWTGEGITTPRTSVTIPSGSTGNRTYTAHWQLNTYKITYDLDDGTPLVTANPETYSVLSPTFTLTLLHDRDGHSQDG